MRKEIFESEEEFDEVMRRTIPAYYYEKEGAKKFRLDHAHEYNLIKKSELEKAEDEYYKDTSHGISVAKYVHQLEKRIKELESK